ncbi:GNAT family N-acetyltransferase [Catellatospora tritici]|uniref:GNAT family N-acetyltransferase n=1 Tax=Catellatospora tritici TaxID=2851566 RepID=UPI001C2CF727|nr:GNAT family N-acetyltransferase [Catellatospora tritici]MBV1849471.1 GNAT family N-acetyltransferase [Catellatospora tritici]MBV1854043.1 GNAT family N-acetyltransferase [Catellatospora tritici]
MSEAVVDGGAVRLRPWTDADIEDRARACDDPEIARYLPDLASPHTTDDARRWIAEGAPATWQAGGAAWAVVDPATDRLLGGASMLPVGPSRNHAAIGYWTAPWARRQGVAVAAARAVADWALRERGCVRLELLTAATNAASQRVALAAGFTREGVRRGAGTDRSGAQTDLTAFVRLAADSGDRVAPGLPDFPGGQLTDGRVVLRRLTLADADDVYALQSLPEVAKTNLGGPITPEHLRYRCERAESEWLAGARADCAILDAATGAFAGDIGLFYQEPFTRQALIGYGLRPEFRGRGMATSAARLISDWALEQAGIIRVCAGTFPYNEASRNVLRRAGFEQEAYLKAKLPGRDGGRIDDIQFVRIAEQYR